MKILILCILSFVFVSCGALSEKSEESLNDEYSPGTGAYINAESNIEDTPVIEVHEPVVPVSNFGGGIEGSSQIDEYIESFSGSTIKIHGSLYLASGELLKNEKITYGYSNSESFDEIGNVDSDEGGQYYFKVNTTKISENLFYIEILVGEIVSRIYFVPDTFDANVFVQEYENLPGNMYFARGVILDEDIITGVDILADPS